MPTGAAALRSSKLVNDATLKIYAGARHGLSETYEKRLGAMDSSPVREEMKRNRPSDDGVAIPLEAVRILWQRLSDLQEKSP